MIKTIPDLILEFQTHFNESLNRFRTFSGQGIMVEGWLKGELLTILDSLFQEGKIDDFDREVRIERRRVDLTVDLNGHKHWIELKHWLNGYQAGTFYGPSFYFGDPTSVGITKDVSKLKEVGSPGYRWILILLASNPGKEEWEKGIMKFNQKFEPSELVNQTTPINYPSEFFLGLLGVL